MKALKKISLLASLLTVTQIQAAGRDYISVVGSSTVYPFSTVVAERFGKSTSFKTPKIESTGTGGGMKLFCKGTGIDTPDISNASRRIKASELTMCHQNGVNHVVEVLIGYDGIVVANDIHAKTFNLTRKDLFLALAKEVPTSNEGELVANPYTLWSQVNAQLPAVKIEVLGPPPTSGTRDAFVELAMEAGCKNFPWIKATKSSDKAQYKSICHTIREDGAYIEAGENDNLIIQKLQKNPDALGIFGFSFLDQNADLVKGALIDGAAPEFATIASGEYPVSRPLYFYVKKAHVAEIPGMQEFLNEFISEKAMGETGYLTDKGLIPLDVDKFNEVKTDTMQMNNLAL
ncbi:PstS family phosphate ABC transporter substrate-binding protein [Marinicella litoralis]|uniref:Phosphate ABC transporter substrate-binding protein (PhoT family) n=1 Tax=Marinicella litoralis TaxID=644220 RepID=A0A4R6XU80_9GAMM|nr:PstS family phosphate ABC transporter substrate-binding protein [Marinicella litoralis]TDR23542.1 phosphate ABC transporter substrate-binding protein (PhoT family) [Marinicella litoralis]